MATNRRIISIIILGWIFYLSPAFFASAAKITDMYDLLSSVALNAGANHTITFTSTSGVDDSTDDIVISFGSTTSEYHFNLSAITPTDIALAVDNDGACDGPWIARAIGAVTGPATWGASVDNANYLITLTAPTDALGTEILAGNCIEVKIGDHLTGGVNQIRNPNITDGIQVGISGSFGDNGLLAILIMNNNRVNVAAEVNASSFPATSTPATSSPAAQGSGGGSYSDSRPPSVISFQVHGITTTTAQVSWKTDEPVTCMLKYGRSTRYELNSLMASKYSIDCNFSLASLTPGTNYFFRAISSDAAGNQTVTDSVFTTKLDMASPDIPEIFNVENVSDFQINASDTSLTLTWSRPGISGPRNILILRSAKFFPRSKADSEVVYSGIEPLTHNRLGSVVDSKNLLPNTIYYYNIISLDEAGHESSGALNFGSLLSSQNTTSTSSKGIGHTPKPAEIITPRIPTPDTQPVVRLPNTEKLGFTDFDYTRNATEKIEPSENEISITTTDSLIISIKKSKLHKDTVSLIINIITEDGPRLTSFKYKQDGDLYFANINATPPGKYPISMGLYNANNKLIDVINGKINVSGSLVITPQIPALTQKNTQKYLVLALVIALLMFVILLISNRIIKSKQKN